MVEIATKTIKIGQNQARTDEIGQKSPGNEVQNAHPKPKMLFSTLTLVRNHFIKVLSEKNSYSSIFLGIWEFSVFCKI